MTNDQCYLSYFQQQSCSAVNYLSDVINIFGRDDPVPVKFGPKGTDPQ